MYNIYYFKFNISIFITLLGCSDGDVRLVNSTKTSEGTVEVCYYNIWGLIADGGWGQEEATVACRQLHYSQGMQL